MSTKAMKICFSIIFAVTLFSIIVGVLTREKEPTFDEKIEMGAVQYDDQKDFVFDAQEGTYSLKITTVYEATPETEEEEAPKADRVVVVVYEYSNDDISEGLVISPAHFRAYDKSGKELEIYPQRNLFEHGEIGALGTHTASVAFALNHSENYIEIDYYNDLSADVPDLVYKSVW